jgi:hypothetical protein
MVLVKITAKTPSKRPQIAKFQNAPKQFLEIALKRAGAGQPSFKTNSNFFSNLPKRPCSTTRARTGQAAG